MEKVSDNKVIAQDQPSSSTTEFKKRPRGRGAKAKSTEKFTKQANKKFMDQRRMEAEKRLGVFNQDAAELEASLKALQVTVQQRAIPLPVATRGAGFATVAEYSRLISSWNAETVEMICTVYQYYRVTLFLITFKVYYSRYGMTKEESYPLSSRFIMNEESRQVLQTVTQVPVSTYNILCAIGSIEGETAFNTYIPDQPLDHGEDIALYLNPFNIRDYLLELSNPETPRIRRDLFFQANPIPGARWINDPEAGAILQNADQIWPDGYDANQLLADIHSYSNLLTRAGNRLPKSFLVNFEWTTKGMKTGTVCMYTAPSRLRANFVRTQQPAVRKKTRNVDGTSREVDIPRDEYRYIGDQQEAIPTIQECWSVDGTTTALELTTGCATYIGENRLVQSRLQIQGRVFASISPGNVLYKMVDAPRA